jgi:hypothetical protein
MPLKSKVIEVTSCDETSFGCNAPKQGVVELKQDDPHTSGSFSEHRQLWTSSPFLRSFLLPTSTFAQRLENKMKSKKSTWLVLLPDARFEMLKTPTFKILPKKICPQCC